MCGIAAIYSYHYAALEVNRKELCHIRDAMGSRGPDGAGEWYSQDGRVGLAHRRLAIIDLSEKAAQPMASQDGKTVVSFNGEIYNYRELRFNLEKKGCVFQSHSDTEVILHLYQGLGEKAVHELRGMFAFALWDEKRKKMLLARDPYGIKPLYYADDGWTVRVASQVRALLTSDKVSRLHEPAGIVSFFLMGSVLEPFTLYQEIRQVPAGSFVWVDETGPSAPKKYFSIAEVFVRHPERSQKTQGRLREGSRPAEAGPPLAEDSSATSWPQNDEEHQFASSRQKGGVPRNDSPLQDIHDALLDSVRHHFISDVPVGLFLSSGIDSGALAGLAQEAGIKNLRTVTLAFDEFEGTEQDEAPLAEEVARLYGTRHSTVRISREELQRELPKIFDAMDQPSIDGINTYFVSKAAREIGLKVALSGLGGDELFGGYPSFQEIPRMVSAMAAPSRIPFLGDAFRHLFNSWGGVINHAFGRNELRPYNRNLIHHPKFAGLIKYGGTYAGAYFLKRGLFMPWELESFLDREVAREGLRRLNLLDRINDEVGAYRNTPLRTKENAFARVAALESSFYLRNQLLRDADWAGMAHSLEIRTPYVDAWLLRHISSMFAGTRRAVSLPSKRFLTDSLKTPLPEKILRRPKTGFSVPVADWLEENKNLDTWRRVPLLANSNCPWARRWAYLVMERNGSNHLF